MLVRRAFGDIDLSDDAVTMGEDLDSSDATFKPGESFDDYTDNLFGPGTSQANANNSTALASTGSGIDWSNLLNTGVGVLKNIFGGSSKPSSSSSLDLAAATAAANAQRTQTYLMVGGLVAAGVVGVILLRRKKRA